ncbi:MAG: glycosyltransferase family 2 protein [Rhizobiaceae bacterium]
MQRLFVEWPGAKIEVICPPDVASQLAAILPTYPRNDEPTQGWVTSEASGDNDQFRLTDSLGLLRNEVPAADLLGMICQSVAQIHAALITDAIALRASAFAVGENSIVVADHDQMGHNQMTTWLTDQGHQLLGTNQVVINAQARFCYATQLVSVDELRIDYAGAADPLIDSRQVETSRSAPRNCSMILMPLYRKAAELQISAPADQQAIMRLLACLENGSNLPGGGLAELQNLASKSPVLLVEYGNLEQLQGRLDRLIQLIDSAQMDSEQVREFFSIFPASTSEKAKSHSVDAFPKPAITPSRGVKRLTIGMATYDDFDGVYFTLQSLRLHHQKILDEAEIIVVDNNPTGVTAQHLKQLDEVAPNLRYIPFEKTTGTSASRDLIFREASGEYVVVMDCHVLLAPGSLDQLDRYFADHPDCPDLLQGPLLMDDLQSFSTQFDPVWEKGMYGNWGSDERGRDPNSDPFEIPMQGLGLFASRRAAWPGFNPRFRGFGGEEGYIHEKFRRNGGRALCLPFLRWVHRFKRLQGVPYPIIWEDRIRNYLIGFDEVGLPRQPIIDHFSDFVGKQLTQTVVDAVKAEDHDNQSTG